MSITRKIQFGIEDYASHALAGLVLGMAAWILFLIWVDNYPAHPHGDDAPESIFLFGKEIYVTTRLLDKGILFPVYFICIGFYAARSHPVKNLRPIPIRITLIALYFILSMIRRYVQNRIYTGWPQPRWPF
jgi:hypothetical protein